jgi:site-specific DNA-adenine methylase
VYYYGAKNALARCYPAPIYPTIIEPFAGSAGYSQYWRHVCDVILIEKDERVVALWHRLQRMSSAQVLALPTPAVGEYYRANSLMDMLIKMCGASNGVAHMTGPLRASSRVVKVWPTMIRRITARVDDVREWDIRCGDYHDASRFRRPMTWFIDPPYQHRANGFGPKTASPEGNGYRDNKIDHVELARWMRTLRGQVIVCEHVGADWLPFRRLATNFDSQSARKGEAVAVWHRP